jgi:hypothetical protein
MTPEFVQDEVEVLAGTHGTLRWQVWASATSDDLMTMLQVFDGDVPVASSGFGGPALYAGHRVNEWRGRIDDLPYFVVARAAVDVSRLVPSPTAAHTSSSCWAPWTLGSGCALPPRGEQ